MLLLNVALGVIIILLLVFMIAVIGRLNLLDHQIDSVLAMLEEADEKLDKARKIIMDNEE